MLVLAGPPLRIRNAYGSRSFRDLAVYTYIVKFLFKMITYNLCFCIFLTAILLLMVGVNGVSPKATGRRSRVFVAGGHITVRRVITCTGQTY